MMTRGSCICRSYKTDLVSISPYYFFELYVIYPRPKYMKSTWQNTLTTSKTNLLGSCLGIFLPVFASLHFQAQHSQKNYFLALSVSGLGAFEHFAHFFSITSSTIVDVAALTAQVVLASFALRHSESSSAGLDSSEQRSSSHQYRFHRHIYSPLVNEFKYSSISSFTLDPVLDDLMIRDEPGC